MKYMNENFELPSFQLPGGLFFAENNRLIFKYGEAVKSYARTLCVQVMICGKAAKL